MSERESQRERERESHRERMHSMVWSCHSCVKRGMDGRSGGMIIEFKGGIDLW